MIVFRRKAKVSRYIQPPAVYVIRWGNPLFRNIHHIIKKLFGTFIMQLWQGIMPPPAVITGIIRPTVLVMKQKIIMIGTTLRNISAFFIAFCIFIDAFSVHPFVERTTMIKYTVQNYLNPSFVGFLHHLCKKRIGGFQICFSRYPPDILRSKTIFFLSVRKKLSPVVHNLSNVRVYIIIILYVILMIRGRNKQRIKIENLDSQILQVIHFIQNTL